MENSVGERIAQLRRQRDWTQDQLAAAAGVHKNTVLHAEKTGDVRISTLKELAVALGVTAAELLGERPARPVRATRRPKVDTDIVAPPRIRRRRSEA